jgi:predicted MFS family arabinose efflux permease
MSEPQPAHVRSVQADSAPAGLSAGLELRRGWKIIVASAIGFGLGLSGIPFYTMGAFIDPLRTEFGWPVSTITAGLTIEYLMVMLVLPFVGRLVDRRGARSVALASLGLFSISYMSLGLSNGSLWLYYASWLALSVAGAGTMAVTWGRAITQVFTVARGRALGLTLIGSGLTGFFGLALSRWLIQTIGWRLAFVALGALPLLIAAPIVFAVFKPFHLRPERLQQTSAERAHAKPPLGRRFWLMGAAFMLVATGVTGLVPNLIKILTTAGIGGGSAVAAASLVGLFVIFGRLACGALLDLFWAPAVGAVFLLLPSFACLLLFLRPLTPIQAAAAAALIGLAAGAEFDLMPYLVSRYFNPRHFAATLGGISRFFYLGAALSGPSLGLAYDRFGDYRPGLAVSGVLCVAGTLSLLSLGKYPASRAPDGLAGAP